MLAALFVLVYSGSYATLAGEVTVIKVYVCICLSVAWKPAEWCRVLLPEWTISQRKYVSSFSVLTYFQTHFFFLKWCGGGLSPREYVSHHMYSLSTEISNITLLLMSIDKGKEDVLQCACENTYSCENNTCWGKICFYSSVHERIVRGCFPNIEQCHVPDVPGLYSKCCFTHFCNANLSVPETTGQSFL